MCLEVLLLGCSGNVFVEEVSSDTLRLGTCVGSVGRQGCTDVFFGSCSAHDV